MNNFHISREYPGFFCAFLHNAQTPGILHRMPGVFFCEVWRGVLGEWSVECGVWSAECRVQSENVAADIIRHCTALKAAHQAFPRGAMSSP